MHKSKQKKNNKSHATNGNLDGKIGPTRYLDGNLKILHFNKGNATFTTKIDDILLAINAFKPYILFDSRS